MELILSLSLILMDNNTHRLLEMEKTEKMASHRQQLFVIIMMELIRLQSSIQMEVKQKQSLKMVKMANHQKLQWKIMEMAHILLQLLM